MTHNKWPYTDLSITLLICDYLNGLKERVTYREIAKKCHVSPERVIKIISILSVIDPSIKRVIFHQPIGGRATGANKARILEKVWYWTARNKYIAVVRVK